MNSFSGSLGPQYTKSSIFGYFNATQAALRPPVVKQSQPLASLQTAAPSPALVKKRGKAGGEAANWGEPRLIEIVLDWLEKETPPEKCENISHLYDEVEELLKEAFKEYKGELNESKKYRNKALTYGKLLNENGMNRKLYQWVKNPDFWQRLVKLGYL